MGVDSVKRNILPVFLATVLFLSWSMSGRSLATVSFERTYGGGGMDHSHSFQQTHDGGYVLLGCTNSFGAGLQDIYMVRTDSLGDTLWTRTYGGSNVEFGFCVQQTRDEGYIVAGLTYPDSGSGDLYLVKVNSSGDTSWTGTYGGTEYDVGRSVRQTQDGGYIAVGLTYSFGADSGDIYLVKTDSIGDTVWTRTYGKTHKDVGRSVEETEDGGYVVAGYAGPFGGGPYDVCLLKLDHLGDTVWTRTYGGMNTEFGHSVQQTSDGGYIIAGNTRSFGAGAHDIYLVKTDSLGDVIWTGTYGGSDEEDWDCYVRQTADDGYIIAGNTESFGSGSSDLYLIRTDSIGDTVWTRTYGGGEAEYGFCAQETRDGGFAAAGAVNSFGAGGEDVYLVKTDGRGFVGTVRDAAVVTIDLPPDTVLVDSTYGVTAAVQNLGNVPLTFDVIATIHNYSDTVHVHNLDPNLSIQAVFEDWPVPAGDSTTYGMTVCARAADDADTTNDCAYKDIFAVGLPGVEERTGFPPVLSFGLSQNSPNPSGNSTTILYSISNAGEVTLTIYDITGRLVETLVNEIQQPGIHQVRWQRKSRPSGVYFYRLRSGDFVETRKMAVVE